MRATTETEPATITYTVTVLGDQQAVEVVAAFPTGGTPSIDLMMAIWSPGFYRVEDYASRVHELHAWRADGLPLAVEHPSANRWRVATGNAGTVHVSYRLDCRDQSVTTNWVDGQTAVLNGPATFITLAGGGRRPHEVQLALPDGWQAQTALPPMGSHQHRFRAADFDALVNSPILAGELEVCTFEVDGCLHTLALAGQRGALDLKQAARDLEQVVAAQRAFWGFLPYPRYWFLVICREGGGGLEHAELDAGNRGSVAGRHARRLPEVDRPRQP